MTDVIDRLLPRVRAGDALGCWLWVGAVSPNGYGQIATGSVKDGSAKPRPVHRVAYECLVGPIPDGLVIDHLCGRPLCVNPAHLEPVTNAENIRRGRGGEWQRQKTHCPQGHPFDPENTRLARGRRICITCARAKQLAYYHSRKARR